MFHFCRRGRENLRDIRVYWFTFNRDENNLEYVTMRDELDKNHRGDDNTSQQTRMYATGMPDCPVGTLKLYVAKLNASAPFFFQRPKMVAGASWYEPAPLGKNTLGSMMQRISKDAGLSQIYTNHCIRATVITSLDHAGVEGRHIQQVSGHKQWRRHRGVWWVLVPPALKIWWVRTHHFLRNNFRFLSEKSRKKTKNNGYFCLVMFFSIWKRNT